MIFSHSHKRGKSFGKDANIFDAWDKLGVTEDTLEACQIMADTCLKDSQLDYWVDCGAFLRSIEKRPYADLSSKQRNWAKGIVSTLREEGLI